MPHESRYYTPNDIELYQTPAYGGADAVIDNTERYTAVIDLTINIGASIDFMFLGGDSTDNWEFRLYKRRDDDFDGTEAAWKTVLTVENDGTTTVWHYTIAPNFEAGIYRVGMVATGSTTTFAMEVQARTWRKTTTIA